MPRFYCPLPLVIDAHIELPNDTAHHVFVLRLNLGDEIELFNGEGGSFAAKITDIGKKKVIANVLSRNTTENELTFNLTLAQGLPEGTKMDWIIEKAVELGVHHIQPLAAHRSVVKLTAERAQKKMAHWQSIIQAATEQCGRNRLAGLSELIDTQKYLVQKPSQKRVMLSPRADCSLSQWAQQHPAQDVSMLIGPEGGFSEAEELIAKQQNVILLNIGPRILRTETAGLAAISILSATWGGM